MDAGHFISRRHESTALRHDNVHPCCVRCNQYLNGNMGAYLLFMVATYGDRHVVALAEESRQTVTRTKDDYRALREYYAALNKELEGKLNGQKDV